MPRSVRRGVALLAVAGLVTAYAGCSSPTGPGSVSGAWNDCGGTSGDCTGLSLTESGSTLSGGAQTATALYTVTGSYDRPHVSLVFVPENGAGATIRYDGTASGGTLTLRTEGSNPQTLVFQRGGVEFPGGGTDTAR
jgi:hypothetical protein